MLTMAQIRDYVSSLGIAPDENVYIGKLDNKKQKSIGVYQRKQSGIPETALGGYKNKTYEIKPVSLLVHWNSSPAESEKAAHDLFERLRNLSSLDIEDTPVYFIRLMVPEPQEVGTDGRGIYEYVIWLDFIYGKKEG